MKNMFQVYRFTTWMALVLVALSLPIAAFGQKQKPAPDPEAAQRRIMEMHEKGMKPPSGVGFFIDAVGENQALFSVLMSDPEKRTVADTFRRSQIEIFEALMVEAKKFAESNEEVGTRAAPKTTRFVDKDEKSFIVDVQKIGDESRLFVTMKCMSGVITIDAGVIPRNKKSYNPPLFESMLTRVHTSLNTVTPPQ